MNSLSSHLSDSGFNLKHGEGDGELMEGAAQKDNSESKCHQN